GLFDGGLPGGCGSGGGLFGKLPAGRTKGRAFMVEHAYTSSRWNSQCRYTFPSGDTMACGAGPNGEARCTESSAATSNAVIPLVRTTPIFIRCPSFVRTISRRVTSFGSLRGCSRGSESSEPRKLSAKIG